MVSLVEGIQVSNYEEGVIQRLFQLGLKVSAFALLRLVQHGYQFGEPFGYSQLRKVGLSERIAKNAIRQFKGELSETIKRRAAKEEKLPKEDKRTMKEQLVYEGFLEEVRFYKQEVREDSNNIYGRFCKVSIRYINCSKTSINTSVSKIRGNKPLGEAWFEFISTYRYQAVDDDFKLKPSVSGKRGRPNQKIFFIPTNDDLAEFLGLVRSRPKNFLEWPVCVDVKALAIELEKAHIERIDGRQSSYSELANRLGVSNNTIVSYHKQAGIQPISHVDKTESDDSLCKYLILANKLGLLRGGTWFEVGEWNYKFVITDKGYAKALELAKGKNEQIYFCAQEANSYNMPDDDVVDEECCYAIQLQYDQCFSKA